MLTLTHDISYLSQMIKQRSILGIQLYIEIMTIIFLPCCQVIMNSFIDAPITSPPICQYWGVTSWVVLSGHDRSQNILFVPYRRLIIGDPIHVKSLSVKGSGPIGLFSKWARQTEVNVLNEL